MYSHLKSRTYVPLYHVLNICITLKYLGQRLSFTYLELIEKLDDKIIFLLIFFIALAFSL